MSQEDVAAVKDAYDALAVGGLDSFIEHWTIDLDHRAIEGAPDDRGPINGKQAMRAYVQDWFATFDGYYVEPVELIDAGERTVVAVLRFGGRAELSGIETAQILGAVFTIRGGKIARGREYAIHEQALEAAGLREC
jgi:ketosteroid isomerase-like protein